MKTKKVLNIIRWTARISGSLLFTFTVIILMMEFIGGLKEHNGSPFSSLSTIIIISFIIWGFALSGLALAIWKEGLGGCISLLGFLTLCIVNFFNPEASKTVGTVIMFVFWMIPSLLYILYWRMAKNLHNSKDRREHIVS